MGDSEEIVAAVECDQHTLKPWFNNRTAEILEYVAEWKSRGVEVDDLLHWLGESNIADTLTKW